MIEKLLMAAFVIGVFALASKSRAPAPTPTPTPTPTPRPNPWITQGGFDPTAVPITGSTETGTRIGFLGAELAPLGAAINDVQNWLRFVGYPIADSTIGWTHDTNAAIAHFQRDEGLQANGVFNGDTANHFLVRLRQKMLQTGSTPAQASAILTTLSGRIAQLYPT